MYKTIRDWMIEYLRLHVGDVMEEIKEEKLLSLTKEDVFEWMEDCAGYTVREMAEEILDEQMDIDNIMEEILMTIENDEIENDLCPF